jgi:mRNA interferase HigB
MVYCESYARYFKAHADFILDKTSRCQGIATSMALHYGKKRFHDFNELREVFASADYVGGLTVFNIGGNKYRLIASIHYNRHKVYIRDVLTHAAYDRGDWKRKNKQ